MIGAGGGAGARWLELTDGAAAAVSVAPGCRLRYNAGALELSVDGGPYSPIGGSTTVDRVLCTVTSAEIINAGAAVVVADNAGVPGLFNADADGTSPLGNVRGISELGAGAAGLPTVFCKFGGPIPVPDAQFDVVPAVTDVGLAVYLSNNVGMIAGTTAPVGPVGASQVRIGWVAQGGAGAVLIDVDVGEVVIL